VADDHGESVSVEEAGLGRLGCVEVAMAIEPDQPESVRAGTRHDRLLAMAVAGEDDRQDAVGASCGDFGGEPPIQIEARSHFGRARLG
jgi:hypothetical protein